MRALLKRFSPLARPGARPRSRSPAGAQDFDYYLLALTWTPSWCLAGGDAGQQCDPARDLGFTLHGLWPQYEDGWPEYCDTDARDPPRRETAAMADVMGSGGLAWYQWKKHGRCTGLAGRPTSRRPAGSTRRSTCPSRRRPGLRRGDRGGALDANPALQPDGVIVTCDDGRVEEVRICLTPELAPRPCGRDVARDACRARGPLDVPPVR